MLFFAAVGGALPIALTIVHLIQARPLGVADVPFWPASILFFRRPISSFTGVALFALACVLNIFWYIGIGWLVSLIISTFRFRRR